MLRSPQEELRVRLLVRSHGRRICILFEEFGTEPLAAGAGTVPPISTSNDPANLELSSTIPRSAPTGAATEVFLAAAGLNPFPTRVANTTLKNPWWSDVCSYIKTVDCAAKPGPAEGRPGGEGWAHQRWDEFPPQRSFKTAQMGSRENLGFRDSRQMHKYAVGEFGPGGLYHRNGTSRGIKVQFHPSMPVQHHHKCGPSMGRCRPNCSKPATASH